MTMSENNYGHHGNEGLGAGSVHHGAHSDQLSYWKRAHHDWRFWVALVLMLTAITIYILSDNLVFLPHVPAAIVDG